jgi:ribosomal protein S18 acetylase RimI-like enzyme
MKTVAGHARNVRGLGARDLDAVVGIDAELSGHSRRGDFERRLVAAQRDAERHVQFAVDEDGAVAGFVLGYALEGEFGRSDPEMRMEALGVRAAAQGRGLGAALAEAFETAAAKRGVREIRTTALWHEHELLRFLDRGGYRLADSYFLDRAITVTDGRDFYPEARDAAEIAVLSEADLEGIARIDRRLTGRDRREYLQRGWRETLTDSAVRISLAAKSDGAVAGFLMARMDYGDFGRVEPVAVIDTVGVDPLRAHEGIGRALLSQLFVNLSALGVERVETVVAPGRMDLLGFFHHAGFRPGERLSFHKRL